MGVDTFSALNQAKSSLRSHAFDSGQRGDRLEKTDFLNLFMTQMSNQNPIDPMDSGKMMTQMSQLGTLEQLQNLNNQFQKFSDTQSQIARFEALKFLGKEISIEDKGIQISKGQSSSVFYKLPEDFEHLNIRVRDYEGELIAEHDLGFTHAGRSQFVWDGKNQDGVLVGDGKYKIEFIALNGSGKEIPVNTFRKERVTQVEYLNGKPMLRMGNSVIEASQVLAVDQEVNDILGGQKQMNYLKGLIPKDYDFIELNN